MNGIFLIRYFVRRFFTPYNYAPRESAYIQMMLMNHALPRFIDADGRFQFVYVKDAAQAVLKVLGNAKAFGQSYNLCQDETVTYDGFFQTLKAAAEPEVLRDSEEVPITVDSAMAQHIPVPFSGDSTRCCYVLMRRVSGNWGWSTQISKRGCAEHIAHLSMCLWVHKISSS